LIAAFKSTMEEILRAKCILHVVDASNPDRNKHTNTVFGVLKDIGADNIPVITAYNKADKLDEYSISSLKADDCYIISAKNSNGIKELLKALENIVMPEHLPHKLVLNFEEQKIISKIYKLANVKSKKYTKKGVEMKLECSNENWIKIKNIIGGEK
jgi:GTPases